MKCPVSWLKELVPCELNPEEIGDVLTMAGLEVEGIHVQEPPFEKVFVGEVVECGPHPEADKLRVTTVTDGTDSYQVVCGAPNCRTGIKVAFAKVGARLEIDGKKIKLKKSKIRGIESFGMLCSEAELGFSEEHEGIVELSTDRKLGEDLAASLGNTILDVALTPNLGHCNSITGIARELAALTGKKLSVPAASLSESGPSIESLTSVEVQDPENCPRYAARVIQNVKVAPSPQWLKDRVEACGVRSLNNIVDITNLILMETGHPLHAFDFDRLAGGRIVVRGARSGERFTTLDDVERELPEGAALICDGEQPVAIGGVMGGLNSEISDASTNVLLESAFFDSSCIRATSKSLSLQTEASRRFERGTDPNGVLHALDRAAQLIAELAGGSVATGVIDVKVREFPPKSVDCRLSRLNKVLGTHLSMGEVEDAFQRLELDAIYDGNDTFTVTAPTYRWDLNIEEDLIEEVARIHGYANIPRDSTRYQCSSLPDAPIYLFEQTARRALGGQGLQELLTCDLIGPSLMEVLGKDAFPEETVIRVQNPTSQEQSILRPTLLPGALQVVRHNLDRQVLSIVGFEVGHIHFKRGTEFVEQSTATVVLTGQEKPQHWTGDNSEVDFFVLKGIVENLLKKLDVPEGSYPPCTLSNFHPGRQAAVLVKGQDVGVIGEVHPSTLRRVGIDQRVYFAELNLHELYALRNTEKRMQPLPQYPASERDWTLTVAEDLSSETVLTAIRTVHSKILQESTLISVYRHASLGENKKNVTFSLLYRHDRKTLAQEAVDKEHARILGSVCEALGNQVFSQ